MDEQLFLAELAMKSKEMDLQEKQLSYSSLLKPSTKRPKLADMRALV